MALHFLCTQSEAEIKERAEKVSCGFMVNKGKTKVLRISYTEIRAPEYILKEPGVHKTLLST